MTILPLVLLGLLGAEEVIDGFEYADAQSARRAWVAKERTPPVDPIADAGRNVLKVAAPFAADARLRRTVIDRKVALDLSAPGRFELEVAVDPPEAVRYLNLYFRSGGGWYSSGKTTSGGGWRKLNFSKTSFRSEESPAGWNKIDAVRIAAWRGERLDATLRLRRLVAVSHEVALVVPGRTARPGDPEVPAAIQAADRLAGMLTDLGLGADLIEQTDLSREALGNRPVVVLAYNPRLGDRPADVLEAYVEAGGKLLICYALPTRLAAAIGFRRGQYVRQQRPGEFAEIRFEAAGVSGLPRSIRQASWNIATAEPVGHGARIIGRWYDDAGKSTGRAAMLLSDRGAYLSHVVLADDREGKKRMLAAILGRFAPSLWREMAAAAVRRVAEVGHCKGFEQLAEHVDRNGNPAAREALKAAKTSFLAAAAKCKSHGEYVDAVELARKARRQLATAYLLAQASPGREGRAVWNHSGTGAYPGDWNRSAEVLAAGGFNMVLPNMLWAGRAHYASEVLPRSSTFAKYGDQVEQCLAAARRHGLQVHVWKVNYNLSGAPREFVARLREQGRLQQSVKGEVREWLCPSHPENQKLELESMLEVARKYAVDGLHFDYIRYPGRDWCYCDGCRRRFQTDSGRQVSVWPDDCYSGPRRKEYNDWRCRQITNLVAAVSRQGKKVRPGLKISAAVFGAYPDCRESIAQDWPRWIEAGLLDFVCPMDYTESDAYFQSLVRRQLRLVDGRIPVYPGIGATASNATLSADRVVGQIHLARRLGASGFTIFNFHRDTAESIVPGVGMGAGKQPAKPF